MEIIVDTNILFPALLGGRVARIFSRAVKNMKIHTVQTLPAELKRHLDRIARYSTLNKETIKHS